MNITDGSEESTRDLFFLLYSLIISLRKENLEKNCSTLYEWYGAGDQYLAHRKHLVSTTVNLTSYTVLIAYGVQCLLGYATVLTYLFVGSMRLAENKVSTLVLSERREWGTRSCQHDAVESCQQIRLLSGSKRHLPLLLQSSVSLYLRIDFLRTLLGNCPFALFKYLLFGHVFFVPLFVIDLVTILLTWPFQNLFPRSIPLGCLLYFFLHFLLLFFFIRFSQIFFLMFSLTVE